MDKTKNIHFQTQLNHNFSCISEKEVKEKIMEVCAVNSRFQDFFNGELEVEIPSNASTREVQEFVNSFSNDRDVIRLTTPKEINLNLGLAAMLARKNSVVRGGHNNISKISIKGGVPNRTLNQIKSSKATDCFSTDFKNVIIGDGSVTVQAYHYISDLLVFELDESAKDNMLKYGERILYNPCNNVIYYITKEVKDEDGTKAFAKKFAGEIKVLGTKEKCTKSKETLLSEGYKEFTTFVMTDSQDRKDMTTFYAINNELSDREVLAILDSMSGGIMSAIIDRASLTGGQMAHSDLVKMLNRFSLIFSGGASICVIKEKEILNCNCELNQLHKNLPKQASDGVLLMRASHASKVFKLNKKEALSLAAQARISGYGIHKGQIVVKEDHVFNALLKTMVEKGFAPADLDIGEVNYISDQNSLKIDGPYENPTLQIMALAKATNNGATAHQIIEQTLISAVEKCIDEKGNIDEVAARKVVNEIINDLMEQVKLNIEEEINAFTSILEEKQSLLRLFKNKDSNGDDKSPYVNDVIKAYGNGDVEDNPCIHPALVKDFFKSLGHKVQLMAEKFHIELKDKEGNNLIGTRVVDSDPIALLNGKGIIEVGEIIDYTVSKKLKSLEDLVAKAENFKTKLLKQLDELNEMEVDNITAPKKFKKIDKINNSIDNTDLTIASRKTKLEKYKKQYGTVVVFKQPITYKGEHYKAVVLSLNEVVARIDKVGTAANLSKEVIEGLKAEMLNSPEKVYVPAVEWIIRLLAGMDFDFDKVQVCYSDVIKKHFDFPNEKRDAFVINAKYSIVGKSEVESKGKVYRVTKNNVKKLLTQIREAAKKTESIGGLTFAVNIIQRVRLECLINFSNGRKYALNLLETMFYNRGRATETNSYRSLVGSSAEMNVDFIEEMFKVMEKVEWNKNNIIDFLDDCAKALRLYQEGTIDAPKKMVYFVNRIITTAVEIQSLSKVKLIESRDFTVFNPVITLNIEKKTGLDQFGETRKALPYSYNKKSNKIVKMAEEECNGGIEVLILEDTMSLLQDKIVSYYNALVVDLFEENKDSFKISADIISQVKNVIDEVIVYPEIKEVIDKTVVLKDFYNRAVGKALEAANKHIEDEDISDFEDMKNITSSYMNHHTDALECSLRTLVDYCDFSSITEGMSEEEAAAYKLYIKGAIINHATYYNHYKKIYNTEKTTKFNFNAMPEAAIANTIGNVEVKLEAKVLVNKLEETDSTEDIMLVNGISLDGKLAVKEEYTGYVSVEGDKVVSTFDLVEQNKNIQYEQSFVVEINNYKDLVSKKVIEKEKVINLLSDIENLVRLVPIRNKQVLVISGDRVNMQFAVDFSTVDECVFEEFGGSETSPITADITNVFNFVISKETGKIKNKTKYKKLDSTIVVFEA